jgi:hypothetical protein
VNSLIQIFLPVLLLCCSLAGLCGCKPEISQSNIDAVNTRFEKLEKTGKKSLSPKEVESILGPPDHVENATIELETQKKEVGLTRYYYKQDGKTIELHFFDNKLINRVPGWNQPPEQEPKKP